MGLSRTQKGILYTFVGFNCFTLVDMCMKLLGQSYDVSVISFWSYFISLVMCIVFSLPIGIKSSLGTNTPLVHIARGVCMLFVSIFSIAALSKNLPLATLYTIIFLSPAVTTIGAIMFYNEHVSKRGWKIIILGFSGIIVAFHKESSFFNPATFYAFGVLCFAVIANLLSKHINEQDSLLTLPFYPALVIVVSLFVYMRGNIPLPEITDIPVFMFGGSLLFFALMGIIQGFRIAPYAKAAPMQYTQMISGIIVGYYVFGDIPNIWIIIGAGMIVASGLLLITQKK